MRHWVDFLKLIVFIGDRLDKLIVLHWLDSPKLAVFRVDRLDRLIVFHWLDFFEAFNVWGCSA